MITNKDYSDLESLPQKEKTTTLLSRWAGILGRIQLEYTSKGKVDVVKTMTNLPIVEGIHPKTIKSFLHGQNVGFFSRYMKSKSDTFNQAVPIFLYAQKLMNKVPYEAWRGQPFVEKVMPPLFSGLPEWDFEDSVSLFTKDEKNPMTVEEARIKMVTDSEKVRHNYSDYKCNSIGVVEWDSIPKFYRSMRMQLWIFNVQKRNPWMILNWDNWDDCPKAMDTVDEDFWQSLNKEKPAKVVDLDAPWL